MDVQQAQQVMFPGASFSEHFITLTQAQFNAIIDDSNVNVYSRNIRAWKTSTNEWFIVDQVHGTDDWITYAIGIDVNNVVKRIEILECVETYDGIRLPGWRAQFYGKKRGSSFDDIREIAGATLSSGQISAGVRRVLSTVAIALSPDN